MSAGIYKLVYHHGTLHWLRWARRPRRIRRNPARRGGGGGWRGRCRCIGRHTGSDDNRLRFSRVQPTLRHSSGALCLITMAFARAGVFERFAEATLCILASGRSITRRPLLGTSTSIVTDIHVPLNLEKFALVWSTGVEPARPPSLLRGTPRGGANRPCEGALSAGEGRNMAILGVRLAALGPACEG